MRILYLSIFVSVCLSINVVEKCLPAWVSFASLQKHRWESQGYCGLFFQFITLIESKIVVCGSNKTPFGGFKMPKI
jgi:uncharacterized membrane protein